MAYTYKLRRGVSSAWQNNNPVLAYGEPGFEKDTFKLKIGDGVKTWNELPYINNSGGSSSSGAVKTGYYFNGIFYENSTHTVVITPKNDNLYIDITNINKMRMYIYMNSSYVLLDDSMLGDEETAGFVKLYSSTGSNEDGTLSQKAITELLNKKVSASMSSTKEECLVISNN